MKYGILGTGLVGQTLGTKLVSLGHDVMLGAREATNSKAAEFVARHPQKASHGTFADASRFGDIVINATKGDAALSALRAAGASNLAGKVLIDVANALQVHDDGLPTLIGGNTDSLGEQIQREFPDAHVVKTLNTMFCGVMVNPSVVPGDSDVFVSGNDDAAKGKVIEMLKSFGWKEPIDLGDITTARGTEQLLPIWLRLWGKLGKPEFNFKIVR